MAVVELIGRRATARDALAVPLDDTSARAAAVRIAGVAATFETRETKRNEIIVAQF